MNFGCKDLTIANELYKFDRSQRFKVNCNTATVLLILCSSHLVHLHSAHETPVHNKEQERCDSHVCSLTFAARSVKAFLNYW